MDSDIGRALVTTSRAVHKEIIVTLELQFLRKEIQRNCDISDANFSGSFSLCGLLLRMRDLFKWENGLPPWEEPEHGLILDWVQNREELWQELEGQDCKPIHLHGDCLDPFEVE